MSASRVDVNNARRGKSAETHGTLYAPDTLIMVQILGGVPSAPQCRGDFPPHASRCKIVVHPKMQVDRLGHNYFPVPNKKTHSPVV